MASPVLQPGATVFVTGVNGLVGSHVVDQLLNLGYNVRGAVRSVDKSSWLQSYFSSKYTSAKLELVSIPDMNIPNCYDEAVKGTDGFIHIASPLGGDDAQVFIPIAINSGLNALKAAARTPSIKRFVYTSSSTAAVTPKPDVEMSIDANTFNEESVNTDWSKTKPQGLSLYSAMKTQAEKACWEWVRENEPGFVFNSVLPNVNFGKVLVPEHQGTPSTIAWCKFAFTSEPTFAAMTKAILPQWFISNTDCALLHIAALIYPDVVGERLFGFAEPFTWNQVLAVFRKIFPDRAFPADIEGLGVDKCKVPNERALELLSRLKGGGEGWAGLEESLGEMVGEW